jgi:NADH-quinone oxidoreductase subunit A
MEAAFPILLFAGCALAFAIGLIGLGAILGPRRNSAVKRMPYESGMDPNHDARRRFDVRFNLVAIAYLIFDVELKFVYPWAVASGNATGNDRSVAEGLISHRGLVFGGVLFFLAMVASGLVYEWRRGVLRWR